MGFNLKHSTRTAGSDHSGLARRKGWRALVAGIAALATLAAPAVASADGGGTGSDGGGGAGGTASIHWLTRDAWPATNAGVRQALGDMGYPAAGGVDGVINTSLGQAIDQCQASYTGDGAADCRLVGVGIVGNDDSHTFTGISNWEDSGLWHQKWAGEVSGKTYSYQGVNWNAATSWTDKRGNHTLNSLANEVINANLGASLRVIVLAKNQPTPPEVPPAAPTKAITPGTSADGMTNTTTITSRTGTGGKKMVFTDNITPNGVSYATGDYKVTDNGADVSGEFDFSHNGDKVTATWKGGNLPTDHEFKFSFDVTVAKPDFSDVSDKASVTWNDQGTGETDNHDFPTWRPNPDKSWIKQSSDGKWQAVIDPSRTNKTGADDATFLDGDVVASVVNGTVAANLAQAPDSVSLSDDWTKAGYIFKADAASKFRVYEADATSERQSSVSDIANTGKDVTDQFTITKDGTTATAKAKASYLAGLKGLAHARQLTLLIPGSVSFANGKGAEQVRSDFGKSAGDEMTFCTAPDASKDVQGKSLTNSASETVNGQAENTNEPKICGYVPPVKKDVVADASQGGDQSSVDGKVVYPGQKVEYQLLTEPRLPSSLAYGIKSVSFTDTYDSYLDVDKASLELMDLTTGKVIPKTKYTTKWDDSKHMMTMMVTDADLIAGWRAGSNPRVQMRFEGTVSKDSPTDHKVDNKWVLTLNNSVTPSNEVFNIPPDINPNKEDNQSNAQGDPSVSIDGKTMLLGDTGNYTVTLDAKQRNQAYDVWKLGVVDDYDERYVSIDQSKIAVLGADGKDYTKQFNVKVIDGVVYAFARTVDTKVPATGETLKGDPQPKDLAAYAKSDEHDALKDPAIDQNLLGQSYQLVMPYTVIKVTKGYVVRNTATQVVNDVRKATNQVSNPLAPINPVKDVTIKVGGRSINGQSVWLNSTFLYQLDSSLIPPNRAYPKVDRWDINDPLNTKVDQYTGQWAVYAQADLYKDGKMIADKGSKIAGSGFDSSAFGGDLFTAGQDPSGAVTVSATSVYKALVSADNTHEAGWRAYIQCTRIAVTDRQDNQFTEHYNDKVLPSNVVWTRTPQLTPSIHIVKWDEKSGLSKGDRNDPKDALSVTGDTTIVFTITNTSNDPEGHGAVFQAKDLKLEDHTIAGDGVVSDLKYPSDWNALVLKPGDHVDVTGTLRGVTTVHTDRAKVTGTPLFECPTTDQNPFNDGKTGEPVAPKNAVTVDGRTLCSDTQVESNQDDWNGKAPTPLERLAQTGAPMAGVVLVVVALAGGAAVMLVTRRRHTAHAASSMTTGPEEPVE